SHEVDGLEAGLGVVEKQNRKEKCEPQPREIELLRHELPADLAKDGNEHAHEQHESREAEVQIGLDIAVVRLRWSPPPFRPEHFEPLAQPEAFESSAEQHVRLDGDHVRPDLRTIRQVEIAPQHQHYALVDV